MKSIIAGIVGMTLSVVSCVGQTNCSTGKALGFSLPPLRLKAELQAEAEKVASTISLPTPATLQAQTVAFESSLSDTEFHSRVVRSDEFYLTRTERLSFVQSIFTPEVVHIGKVPVSCTIVTAIKRKNPLCLLNPYFIQISW